MTGGDSAGAVPMPIAQQPMASRVKRSGAHVPPRAPSTARPSPSEP